MNQKLLKSSPRLFEQTKLYLIFSWLFFSGKVSQEKWLLTCWCLPGSGPCKEQSVFSSSHVEFTVHWTCIQRTKILYSVFKWCCLGENHLCWDFFQSSLLTDTFHHTHENIKHEQATISVGWRDHKDDVYSVIFSCLYRICDQCRICQMGEKPD